MTHTQTDLKKSASLYGATVEEDSGGRWKVLQCVAPSGKVWQDTSGKHIRVEWLHGESGDRQAAITDAIQRMKSGVRDMTDQEKFECDEE